MLDFFASWFSGAEPTSAQHDDEPSQKTADVQSGPITTATQRVLASEDFYHVLGVCACSPSPGA